MGRYIVRRLLQMIPVLFGVSLVVFFIIRLKGDPVLMLVPDYYTEEQIQEVRRAYGLDKPVLVQYVEFLGRAVRGDFGRSFQNRQPAWDLVMAALPRTAQLTITALVIGVVMALPLGIVAALKRNSPIDLLVTFLAMVGRTLPSFWLGLMLILLFAVNLRWLPVSGTGDLTGEGPLRYLILPSLTLAAGLVATLTPLIRSSMLEVIREDFITTARAKGASERVVIFRHALRNALVPVVTVIGLNIAWLLGGAVIVEEVFAWPGMGRLIYRSVQVRDLAVVQAGVFIFALIVMLANLLVDLSYGLLDPRISFDNSR